jgi:formylglycine-generating enzyme
MLKSFKVTVGLPLFFIFISANIGFAALHPPRMQSIPKGCFMMGSIDGPDNEKPYHEVCLDSFLMDSFEVNQKNYEQVMGHNPSYFKGENFPVEGITWKEARKYCSSLKKRLPTEAEFEYAARAGTKTNYPWGNNIGKNNANCSGCGSEGNGTKAAPVGSFQPNSWELHDMVGNVWEWVSDWYHPDYYTKLSKTNPKGPKTGTEKSFRSSSWYFNQESSHVSSRNRFSPDKRFLGVGFRCVQ